MSTRTNIRPQQVIPSAQGNPVNGQSMAADIFSAPTIMQSLTVANYSVAWSGTSPVGAIAIEASNDFTLNPLGGVSGGTWNALPLSLGGQTVFSIPVTGNSGNGMIDIDTLGAGAIRLHYIATSGVGALAAYVSGKVQ